MSWEIITGSLGRVRSRLGALLEGQGHQVGPRDRSLRGAGGRSGVHLKEEFGAAESSTWRDRRLRRAFGTP